MTLRADNAIILAKIEPTAGVDANPDGTNNAILVENLDLSFNPNLITTDEKTGTLDPAAPIVGGIQATFTFEVWLKGTSAAGTAPEWGALMQSCGFAEVLTAANIPVAAELATSGSATSLTLSAGAAAIVDLYRGMPINLTVNPTDYTSFVTDYTAAKLATLAETFSPVLDNTTNYQILANTLYKPASNNLQSTTIYTYIDGVRYQLLGCVGEVSLAMQAGGAAKLTFAMSGLLSATGKDDIAIPAATYDADSNGELMRPPVWKNGKMYIDRIARGLSAFNISSGNDIDFPPNPNKVEGYDSPRIVRRNVKGDIDPNEVLVASSDLFNYMRSATKFTMVGQAGTVAGNRWGVTVPSAQATNQTPADRNRTAIVNVPFAATGADKGFFLTLY